MSRRRGRSFVIALAFLASAAASIALTIVYALGGQVQLEGTLLFVALGGISVGLIAWAARFMPPGPVTEEREITLAQPEEEAAEEEAFASGVESVERRGLLGGLLAAAVGSLGVAALFPIRSLGESPGRALFVTSWRAGMRAVTADGRPVRADELPEGAVLTVFPEGHAEQADSQVLLIRLPEALSLSSPGRPEWTADGLVAFSKICTHAGCPVGLYQADTAELFCPCHQSVFLVPEGAKPTNGPATRALPQLPIEFDPDGFVVATGDFAEPVGPAFWSIDRG